MSFTNDDDSDGLAALFGGITPQGDAPARGRRAAVPPDAAGAPESAPPTGPSGDRPGAERPVPPEWGPERPVAGPAAPPSRGPVPQQAPVPPAYPAAPQAPAPPMTPSYDLPAPAEPPSWQAAPGAPGGPVPGTSSFGPPTEAPAAAPPAGSQAPAYGAPVAPPAFAPPPGVQPGESRPAVASPTQLPTAPDVGQTPVPPAYPGLAPQPLAPPVYPGLEPVASREAVSPQQDAPRYESPRYDAPRYESPRYDAPRYGAPVAPSGFGSPAPGVPAPPSEDAVAASIPGAASPPTAQYPATGIPAAPSPSSFEPPVVSRSTYDPPAEPAPPSVEPAPPHPEQPSALGGFEALGLVPPAPAPAPASAPETSRSGVLSSSGAPPLEEPLGRAAAPTPLTEPVADSAFGHVRQEPSEPSPALAEPGPPSAAVASPEPPAPREDAGLPVRRPAAGALLPTSDPVGEPAEDLEKATMLEKVGLGVAVVGGPIGLGLAIVNGIRGVRRRGWLIGVARASLVLGVLSTIAAGIGGVALWNVWQDQLAHDEVAAASAAFCAAAAETPEIVEPPLLGWPAPGATITESIESMTAWTTRWTELAAQAPDELAAGMRQLADNGQTIVDNVTAARIVDDVANRTLIESVAARSGVASWHDTYCAP